MIISKYNATDAVLFSGNITAAKVLLLHTLNFNPAHTTLDQVTQSGALEVYGNGWAQGGMLANVTIVTVSAHVELRSTGVQVLASGGAIGPAVAGVMYANSEPFLFFNFEGDKFTINGHYFSISWINDTILIGVDASI